MIFTSPLWLALLPLALLPLFFGAQAIQGYPSLAAFKPDVLSRCIDWGLTLAGVIAISGLILGNAGLAWREQTIERIGEGAHIALLIDRSASMDNTFAGRQPSGEEESKSAAARRLLKEFVAKREHDRFGVVAFSTAPMYVLPLTDHKDIIYAAVDAMDRPGLAFTDVGRGLAMALAMQEQDPSHASRAIVLVSDGAAVIGRRLQEQLRADFARRPLNLYWLFLRTAGTRGIFDVPEPSEQDTPQAFPERHLHKFLESLGVPYKAFEAESPEAVATAIAEISKLERMPISYAERLPQRDLSRWAYLIAALAFGLLVLAKIAERNLTRREVSYVRA
jgi:mxaC protein